MTTEKPDGVRCTYLLPIRRDPSHRAEIEDLARYFKELAESGCEVVVVDGSPAKVFNEHHAAWHHLCQHLRVDPKYRYLNGKVNGVLTGLDVAGCEYIVLADDDIRYTRDDIRRMTDLLERHEMVRPQNYISPLPWWARTEMARMLINRGVLRTGDYPGTSAFRRSTFRRFGHYDGDVLFDNEEIVRHFVLNGADVCNALDFFILKRPSTFRKWKEQRPRQAYEDLGMRFKTLCFLVLIPAVITLALTRGSQAALLVVSIVFVCAALLALRGLWRDKAFKFFPPYVILYSPLWVLERAISVYLALYWRVVRGGYPFGEQLLAKGTGRAWLARRDMVNPRG